MTITDVDEVLALFDAADLDVTEPVEVARWPVGPVRRLLELADVSDNELKRRGINVKWSRERLTTYMADKIACEILHVHPSAIWSDWICAVIGHEAVGTGYQVWVVSPAGTVQHQMEWCCEICCQSWLAP